MHPPSPHTAHSTQQLPGVVLEEGQDVLGGRVDDPVAHHTCVLGGGAHPEELAVHRVSVLRLYQLPVCCAGVGAGVFRGILRIRYTYAYTSNDLIGRIRRERKHNDYSLIDYTEKERKDELLWYRSMSMITKHTDLCLMDLSNSESDSA